METFKLVLAVIALGLVYTFPFLLYFIYRGFRSRLVGGKFRIAVQSESVAIETSLGHFEIDSAKKEFRFREKNVNGSVLFTDIQEIDIISQSKDAMLSEFLFEDFTVLDFFPDFRDQYVYCAVSLRTSRGAIPIMSMQQYQVRDLFPILSGISLAALHAIGFYTSIEERAKEARSKILVHLLKAGVPLEHYQLLA